MKAILISIKPKWVAKILNGEKTIEIRKTYPKCDLPIYVYIYCTKDKKGIFKERHSGYTLLNQNKWIQSELNGKVVAKFTLNKVEEIKHKVHWEDFDSYYMLGNMVYDDEETCVSEEELSEYLKDNTGYAWHISNLIIFDKPKELSEFRQYGYEWFIPVEKAPQSMCYIEVE